MLHIYYGDGKGKTTAAMGLALRALGHAKHVTILQFLKDGSSGEIALLRRCGADVHACPNAKFTWLMTADEKAEAREHNNAALRTALAAPFDLLVLDEACAACRTRRCTRRSSRPPPSSRHTSPSPSGQRRRVSLFRFSSHRTYPTITQRPLSTSLWPGGGRKTA